MAVSLSSVRSPALAAAVAVLALLGLAAPSNGQFNLAQTLAQAVRPETTVPLNDPELSKLLLAAAAATYDLGDTAMANDTIADGNLFIRFKTLEYLNSDEDVQVGVFEILKPARLSGKTIMAFRGTLSILNLIQDVSILFSGNYINQAIAASVELAVQQDVDYVTGHSLGGILAEAVCSYTGIPGASWNGPGLYSPSSYFTLLGDQFDGVPFDVHLAEGDILSLYGGASGPLYSHIGTPWGNSMFWHPAATEANLLLNHQLAPYCDRIGCFCPEMCAVSDLTSSIANSCVACLDVGNIIALSPDR